jgi:hypothetical protein
MLLLVLDSRKEEPSGGAVASPFGAVARDTETVNARSVFGLTTSALVTTGVTVGARSRFAFASSAGVSVTDPPLVVAEAGAVSVLALRSRADVATTSAGVAVSEFILGGGAFVSAPTFAAALSAVPLTHSAAAGAEVRALAVSGFELGGSSAVATLIDEDAEERALIVGALMLFR